MTLLNRSDTPRMVSFDWVAEDVQDTQSNLRPEFDKYTYGLRNLITHRDAGTTRKPLEVTVPARDVVMYRLDRK